MAPSRINPLYIIFFFAFNMVMLELHEQAHLITGYGICGCYGTRVVNTWNTCTDCRQAGWLFLAAFAGPLFSYWMIWMGTFFFLRATDMHKRSMGFALVFANMPLARVVTAIMGGGDEKAGFALMGFPVPVAKLLAMVLVLFACLLPLVQIGRRMSEKRKWWALAGFGIIPMLYGFLYSHRFLNYLLASGWGRRIRILGTPDLLIYHTVFMAIIGWIAWKMLVKNDNRTVIS
ncbi:MAG: hypothetical protein J7578_14805 [Chitinophagaceae bacterium]|nr:hypothetical protein [Chitinophagaceae bacterium]